MTVDTSPSKVIILETVACCTEHQAEVIVIRHLLRNREATRHLQRRRHWSRQQPLYRSHDMRDTVKLAKDRSPINFDG